jgi:nucleoside 2-deoxyribosyltransferase
MTRTPKVYIATGLENHVAARQLASRMEAAGWQITYAWWVHGSVQGQGPAVYQKIASSEMNGVKSADVVIALLPGGRGTHTEIGCSLGLDKPVILYPGHDEAIAQDGRFCVFYFHPLVNRMNKDQGIDEVIEAANKLYKHFYEPA